MHPNQQPDGHTSCTVEPFAIQSWLHSFLGGAAGSWTGLVAWGSTMFSLRPVQALLRTVRKSLASLVQAPRSASRLSSSLRFV